MIQLDVPLPAPSAATIRPNLLDEGTPPASGEPTFLEFLNQAAAPTDHHLDPQGLEQLEPPAFSLSSAPSPVLLVAAHAPVVFELTLQAPPPPDDAGGAQSPRPITNDLSTGKDAAALNRAEVDFASTSTNGLPAPASSKHNETTRSEQRRSLEASSERSRQSAPPPPAELTATPVSMLQRVEARVAPGQGLAFTSDGSARQHGETIASENIVSESIDAAATTDTAHLSPAMLRGSDRPLVPAQLGPHRAAPDISTLAQHVAQRYADGGTTFEIQLDPLELGPVRISLEVAADSRVTATIAAENAQTLSDLMRTSRELENALESAGLQLAENGLNFSFSSGDPDRQNAERRQDGSTEQSHATLFDPDSRQGARPFGLDVWSGSRIDLTV